MFDTIYLRLKGEVRSGLLLFALALACLGAVAIAVGFLCAAGFIYALNNLGPIYACLIAFGVFIFGAFILVLLLAALNARRRRIKREQDEAMRRSWLADPQIALLGLRTVQAIGIKRLLPIVALGAAAFAIGSTARAARPGRHDRNAR